MNQLDTEALALFHASSAQTAKWEDFTPGQKNCWRSVAMKAREMYAPKPSFPEEAIEVVARVILECQEFSEAHYGRWEDMDANERERWTTDAVKVLRAAAPYLGSSVAR